MLYRKIGSTGMEASVIGLGAEHLEKKSQREVDAVIHRALDYGENIIDVFMPGADIRRKIGHSLQGRRSKVLLQGHIGACEKDGQFLRTREMPLVRKYFDELLEYYQTDYMDFGMLFYVDTETDFAEATSPEHLDYVRGLKKEGKIRAIGASTHNPEMGIRLVEQGLVDLLLFSTNPVYDMLPAGYDINDSFGEKLGQNDFFGMAPVRRRLYELCQQRGVAITTMKTLAAGMLLNEKTSPFARAMTVGQCIHYALTRPAVVSTLIGCRTQEEVDAACAYLTLTDEEKDYSVISQSFTKDFQGKCMYCNHCLPCPAHIDIAALTKLLDIARLSDSLPASVSQHYHALEHRADECVQCGSCEQNCPFGVAVIRNMEEAQAIFG